MHLIDLFRFNSANSLFRKKKLVKIQGYFYKNRGFIYCCCGETRCIILYRISVLFCLAITRNNICKNAEQTR